MFTKRLPLVLAGALLLAPAIGHAQQADPRARSMIRQAMEDYQNLDIDGALNRLRLALNACGRNNCSPAMVARVHIAMGVVAVGGQNDAAAGTNEFVQALQLDPNAEPDAMLVTPEITNAFNQARSRSGGGGGGGGNTNTNTNNGGGNTGRNTNTNVNTGGGNTNTGGGGGSRPSGSTPNLLHTPVAEQLENTPVPVYVEAPAGLGATRYVVHYRGLGMQQFAELGMDHVANGFGGEIPCGQVIRPNLEYYVTAADDSGNVVATAGSPETPTRLTIVATRSQPAPALPGRMPPETCGEDCPPGMTGPQCRHGGGGGGGSERGSRQLGDPCESNNQCGEGLHCAEGACASGEAGGGSSGGQREWYRLAFDVGGGLGSAWLNGTPTYAENRRWDPTDPMGPVTCGRLDADGNPTFVCPPINSPGFAPAGFIYFGARVNVINRIGIGASVRWQWDAASVGTLPSLFIGGRVYVAVTPQGFARRGFTLAPFVGSGIGQMQARPALARTTMGQAAHVISGLNNFHFGVNAEYGFGLFHVGAALTANFQVPTFLFVLDAQVMVGLHFL